MRVFYAPPGVVLKWAIKSGVGKHSTRRKARFGAGLAVVTNLMVLGTTTPVLKFEQECDGLWREAQNLFGPMPSYIIY